MKDIGRILLLVGAVIAATGLIFMISSRFGLGRLPGDFAWRRGNVSVYVPLATSLILSILLTVILWLFRR